MIRKLRLRFFINEGERGRLVLTFAKFSSWGMWRDAQYIHTEEGKFHVTEVRGEIHEEWIVSDVPDVPEESIVDSPLLP